MTKSDTSAVAVTERRERAFSTAGDYDADEFCALEDLYPMKEEVCCHAGVPWSLVSAKTALFLTVCREIIIRRKKQKQVYVYAH